MRKFAKLLSFAIAAVMAAVNMTIPSSAATTTKTFKGEYNEKKEYVTYEFTLKEDSKVYYTYQQKDPSATIKLYRDDDSKIDDDKSISGKAGITTSQNYYLSKGNYYFEVLTHCKNPYTLKLTAESNTGKYESEPNDTMKTASTAKINKVITGNVLRNDTDWYKVKLDKPGRIYLQFDHANISSSAYWRVKLFDKNEKELINFTSAESDTRLSSANLFLKKGTYYIKIQGDYSANIIDYNLTVKFKENKGQFESEANDTRKTANSIALNKEVTGNINNAGDADFYKFKLSSKSSVSITFKHPNQESNNTYWKISVFDADDEQVLTFDSKGDKAKMTSSKTTLSAGTYYIKVTGYNSYYTNSLLIDYTLIVNK